MFSKVFLAQTNRESGKAVPERFAYMALHFSPYSKGLSNMPATLPQGSLLLLDDSMPPQNHDAKVVTNQLVEMIEQFTPAGILLDFQRPKTRELEKIATSVVQALPCPVGVPQDYARDLGCPVLLPPPPVNKELEDYLRPWLRQGIFLEIAPEAVEITVTEKGSSQLKIPLVQSLGLSDSRLCCHYSVEVFPDKAIFTICRYKEDLVALVQEAEKLGVLGCVGLHEELQN